MAAKKNKIVKKTVKKKKTPEAKRKKTSKSKRVNKEINAIEKDLSSDTESKMFNRIVDEQTVSMKAQGGKGLNSFYKKMALKCMSCEKEFSHEVEIKPVDYELCCPHCSETHKIRFKPTNHVFTVHSKTVKIKGD